jgi:carboxyl-terminal processing protease
MNRRYFAVSVLILTLVVCIVASPSARAVGKLSTEAHDALRLFTGALEVIEAKYVEEVDIKELIYDAIGGMLNGLDPHSGFLDPEDLKNMKVETEGKFGGLGIEIMMLEGYVKIVTPIDDTPASRAGLKAGDLIVKIDGKLTKGMNINEAVDLMRGKPDTSITLTIWREGSDSFDVDIVRDIIKIIPVKHEVLEPGYGYIRIRTFSQEAQKGVKKAIEKLKEDDGGLKGLVVDLRNNPGGLLDQAVGIANEFLSDGLIVYTRGRSARESMTMSARGGGTYLEGPLVVLINSGSASASEIVAGALKDRERAVLVGVKTFGKASVQSLIPIGRDVALRLTTAKYFTPSGHDIQAKGITPDFVVSPDQVNVWKKDPNNVFGERNLRNRLKNEEEEGAESDDKGSDAPDVETEKAADPQLEQALGILKAWDVFHNVSAK